MLSFFNSATYPLLFFGLFFMVTVFLEISNKSCFFCHEFTKTLNKNPKEAQMKNPYTSFLGICLPCRRHRGWFNKSTCQRHTFRCKGFIKNARQGPEHTVAFNDAVHQEIATPPKASVVHLAPVIFSYEFCSPKFGLRVQLAILPTPKIFKFLACFVHDFYKFTFL